MTTELVAARSRRTVLIGALGGVAAVVARSLGQPARATAADNDPLLIGVENHATSVTNLVQDTVQLEGLHVTSQSETAIYGESSDAGGVIGNTFNGTGVYGGTTATKGSNAGVMGISSGFSGSVPGVHGESFSATGIGVRGVCDTGNAIRGDTLSGQGVHGIATTGVGLNGQATTGYALRTNGRVRLDKSAGIATVLAGSDNVVVTPGIDLTSTSAVVATLNGNAGTATVRRVSINATTNAFTIWLTGPTASAAKVAWIVLG